LESSSCFRQLRRSIRGAVVIGLPMVALTGICFGSVIVALETSLSNSSPLLVPCWGIAVLLVWGVAAQVLLRFLITLIVKHEITRHLEREHSTGPLVLAVSSFIALTWGVFCSGPMLSVSAFTAFALLWYLLRVSNDESRAEAFIRRCGPMPGDRAPPDAAPRYGPWRIGLWLPPLAVLAVCAKVRGPEPDAFIATLQRGITSSIGALTPIVPTIIWEIAVTLVATTVMALVLGKFFQSRVPIFALVLVKYHFERRQGANTAPLVQYRVILLLISCSVALVADGWISLLAACCFAICWTWAQLVHDERKLSWWIRRIVVGEAS
jgi:hypothetical protein